MNLRKIQDANLKNKRVLLRVDFNVAEENGKVKESFKIKAAKKSIDYLLSQNAKVALISHFGRPEGKVNPEFSLGKIEKDIEEILGVELAFISDCVGDKVKEAMEDVGRPNLPADVLLLENVRFYPGEENPESGGEFVKLLSENFDIFVNDAFSVCHRDQASVTGVAKLLPSFAGFWLQEEIENLDKVKNNPVHPAVAIIGGAKIETKLPLIKNFEKNYDYVLVGGRVAVEAMDQKMQFSEKVILPIDFAQDKMDIGPGTIKKFQEIIKNAKTIVWNGPMGKFEEKPYDIGTMEILASVIASGAFSLMGGGESVQILEEHSAMDKISFVSTGGGAMLEYLSGAPMPGIDALRE
jgi:phosphoglycerate kinase